MRSELRCGRPPRQDRAEIAGARLIYDVAVAESRYLRYPNLRGDLLTFVADDDVWLAPADGGRAWRISADRAQAAGPRLSADASLVAWTSWRDGLPEIYLAGTDGSGAARVSYWSNAATRLRGWSPDGDILATTAASQPFQHYTWAYADPGHRRPGPVRRAAQAAVRTGRRRRDGRQRRRSADLELPGSGVLEAVPRRHVGPPVGRPGRHRTPDTGRRTVGRRLSAGIPPAARRSGRPVLQPDAGQRPAGLHQRLRGHGQRVLVRARRHRSSPPHRP